VRLMKEILRTERKFCLSCMETHNIQIVEAETMNIFKGIEVHYTTKHFFCDRTEEFFSDEELIAANDRALKDAYRKAKGLLTSEEIIAIRRKYGITQRDLCLLLGWGEKTITRYESHQVQDFAHDSILRKLADDPAWFLTLLETLKTNTSVSNWNRYRENAEILFGEKYCLYRTLALSARRFSKMKATG